MKIQATGDAAVVLGIASLLYEAAKIIVVVHFIIKFW